MQFRLICERASLYPVKQWPASQAHLEQSSLLRRVAWTIRRAAGQDGSATMASLASISVFRPGQQFFSIMWQFVGPFKRAERLSRPRY